MSEERFAGYHTSFEDLNAGLDDIVVPPTVLARWAAMAGQLATVGYVPSQPQTA
ncbi:MAG TPA: hypothetical protein PKB06_02650 [Actinotalea sp.]|nr:hypothetical protein [Actinotalea sp.]